VPYFLSMNRSSINEKQPPVGRAAATFSRDFSAIPTPNELSDENLGIGVGIIALRLHARIIQYFKRLNELRSFNLLK
jgi:hypothetical protein